MAAQDNGNKREKSVKRRDFLKGAAATTAGLVCNTDMATAENRDEQQSRPNLVYVFADQLRYQSLGYAGDPRAQTPNIDRFAARSVDFHQAVSSMPVCCAHRASLMTGKYTTSTGMVINELRMNPAHRCFGHVLTDAGYRTGYIGKWHLYANELGNHYDPNNSYVPPGEDRLGFDGYWAAYNFHHNYYDAYYHTNSPEKLSYGEGVYEPDGQTDMAIDFVERAADGDEPFALFLSWGPPHNPWGENNVPERFLKRFEGVKFPNPPNYEPENDPYADGWGRLNDKQREQLSDWRRVYYAMNANLDWNFGRLMRALEDAGVEDDTIVVFSSDHGEMFRAHGRRAKNTFYEEAARIPFLVRWPGAISPATKSDACISNVDFMPTILAMMDLEIPDEVEGMDVSHLAMGQDGPEPEAAFLQNTGACAIFRDGHEWRAMRDNRYTYAIYRRDRKELLFDNKKDPYQMNDLAGDPEHRDELERLRSMMSSKMESLNDQFHKCTWYKENWIENRIIKKAARPFRA